VRCQDFRPQLEMAVFALLCLAHSRTFVHHPHSSLSIVDVVIWFQSVLWCHDFIPSCHHQLSISAVHSTSCGDAKLGYGAGSDLGDSSSNPIRAAVDTHVPNETGRRAEHSNDVHAVTWCGFDDSRHCVTVSALMMRWLLLINYFQSWYKLDKLVSIFGCWNYAGLAARDVHFVEGAAATTWDWWFRECGCTGDTEARDCMWGRRDGWEDSSS